MVATSLGFFLLGGVAVHGLNLTGIAINTLGGTWYGSGDLISPSTPPFRLQLHAIRPDHVAPLQCQYMSCGKSVT